MRLLPWRKVGVFDKNPWDEDVGLSGWTPGLNQRADMMAMLASLAKAQWDLGAWLERVSRVQSYMSRCLLFCALMWVLVAVVNLNFQYHWWQ